MANKLFDIFKRNKDKNNGGGQQTSSSSSSNTSSPTYHDNSRLSDDQFVNQVKTGMSYGLSKQDAINKVNSGTRWNQPAQQPTTQQNTQQTVNQPRLVSYQDKGRLDDNQFVNQVKMGMSAGLSKQDAINQVNAGTRYQLDMGFQPQYDGDGDFKQGALYTGKKFLSGVVGGQRTIVNDLSYKSQGDVATQLAENDYARYTGGDAKAKAEADKIYQNYLNSIPEAKRIQMERNGTLLDEGSVYLQEKTKQYEAEHKNDKLVKASSMGEKWAQEIEEKNANLSDNWKFVGGVSESIGQQAPMLAARAVPLVGQAISSAMFFSSASGAAIEQALSEGATKDEALTYGTIIGGIEAGTEALGDVVGKGMKLFKVTKEASLDDFSKALIASASKNKTLRTVLSIISSANDEGIEEVISDLVSPFAKSVYNNKSGAENWKEDVTVEQLWQDYLAGAISGGIMTGVGGAKNGTFREQNQILADKTVENAVSEFKAAKGSEKGKKFVAAAEAIADTTQKRQNMRENLNSIVENREAVSEKNMSDEELAANLRFAKEVGRTDAVGVLTQEQNRRNNENKATSSNQNQRITDESSVNEEASTQEDGDEEARPILHSYDNEDEADYSEPAETVPEFTDSDAPPEPTDSDVSPKPSTKHVPMEFTSEELAGLNESALAGMTYQELLDAERSSVVHKNYDVRNAIRDEIKRRYLLRDDKGRLIPVSVLDERIEKRTYPPKSTSEDNAKQEQSTEQLALSQREKNREKLDNLTPETLHGLTDEQISKTESIALSLNHEKALSLLDDEYKRRHSGEKTVEKTGNALYDTAKQREAEKSKGEQKDDSSERNGNDDNGSSREKAGSSGTDRQGTGERQSEASGNTSEHKESGNRDVQEERVRDTEGNESVSEENPERVTKEKDKPKELTAEEKAKAKADAKTDERLIAMRKHFATDKAFRNLKKAQHNIEAQIKFCEKVIGKLFNSESLARRLANHYQDLEGFAYDALYGAYFEEDGLSQEEISRVKASLAYSGILDDFLKGNIDEQELSDVLGVSKEMAKSIIEHASNNILEDMVDARILDKEFNVRGNKFARESTKHVLNSGKDNKTATVPTEKVGDAKTVNFKSEKYVNQETDVRIPDKNNKGNKIYMRSDDKYIVVDKKGYIIAEADDYSTALAKAHGSINTYLEAKIKLHGSEGIIETQRGTGIITFNTENAFGNRENYVTQQRSAASDIAGVKYDNYGGAKGTTDYFILNVRAENRRSVDGKAQQDNLNLLHSILAGEGERRHKKNAAPGIRGSNGENYVFFGMTANGAKKGDVIMVKESIYEKMREASLCGLTPEEIKEFNPAKYMANQGFLFSPSNDDTGVKIENAVILPDVFTLQHDMLRKFMRVDDTLDKKELTAIMKFQKEKYISEGMSESEADKAVEKIVDDLIARNKVGYTFNIIGDLFRNAVDGCGLVMSDKPGSFQMRGPGGTKGFLINFDFVSFFNDFVPVSDAEYSYYTDGGETSGGIRHLSEEKGVEIRDKWGEWRSIKDCKALLFDSTFKFAGNFNSMEDVWKHAGKFDIRSIPKENVYGSSDSTGMVEGYKRVGLAQFLRGQTDFTKKEMDTIVKSSVNDIIDMIMNDKKMQGKLLGVDFDSKVKPSGNNVKADMLWFFGEGFLDTRLGQKWVSDKLGEIVEQAKAGQMYVKDNESSYQWIAPDVVGLLNKMTAIRFQGSERDEAFGGLDVNGFKGIDAGQVYIGTMKEGTTLIGRNPSAKTSDIQTRQNVRLAIYDELGEKYGLDNDITFKSLNDILELHLDNDYDGDAVIAIQGALAEVVRSAEERREKQGRNMFVQFAHAKAGKEDISKADVLWAACRRHLDARSIGEFDNLIEMLDAFSDNELKPAAKRMGLSVSDFRDLLQARFSTAYILAIDQAKTGVFPKDFEKVIDETSEMLDAIAAENGYFVEFKKDKKGNDTKVRSNQIVPSWWQFSKKASKREAYYKARREAAKALGDKKAGYSTLSRANNLLAAMASGKTSLPTKSYDERGMFKSWYNTFAPRLQDINGKPKPMYDLSQFSTANPLAYTALSDSAYESLSNAWQEIMRDKSMDGKDISEIVKYKHERIYELQKSLGLNNQQFTDLMLYVLGVDDQRMNFDLFLSLDQSLIDPSNKEMPTNKLLSKNITIAKNVKIAEAGMASVQENIDNLSKAAKEAEENLSELTKRRKGAFNAMQSIRMDNAFKYTQSIQQEIYKTQKLIDKMRDEKRSVFDRDEIMEMDREIDILKSKLASLKSTYNDASAFADSNAFTEEISKSIEPINIAVRNASRQLDALYEAIESLQKEFESLSEQYEESEEIASDTFNSEATSGLENLSDEDIVDAVSSFLNPDVESDSDSSEQTVESVSPVEADKKEEPSPAPKEESAPNEEVKKEDKKEESESAKPKAEDKPKPERAASVPAKEKPVSSNRKAWNRAKRWFGGQHGKVTKAAKSLMSFTEQNKDSPVNEKISSFSEAVANMNDGFSTPIEVFEAYESLKGTRYYDEDGMTHKKLRELVDTYKEYREKIKNDEDIKDPDALGYLASDAVNSFVAHAKRVVMNNERSQHLALEASKSSSKKPKGKFSGLLKSWQINAPTFFKMLSGFKSDSVGYEINDEISDSVKEEMTVVVEANRRFEELKGKDGYEDFVSGKTKVHLKTLGRDISAVEAVYLSRVLDSTKVNRRGNLASVYGFAFKDSNGEDVVIEINTKDNQSKAGDVLREVNNYIDNEAPSIVLDYYNAVSDVFKVIGKKARTVALNVDGFSPDFMEETWYAPIRWYFGKESLESFDMPEEQLKNEPSYMKSRSAKSNGILAISPMTSVVDAYVAKMADYIAYKELRADLRILNAKSTENLKTLAEISGENFGQPFARFINNYVKDMTNTKPYEETIFGKLRNNMQKGVLIGNPSVMMKQSSSYWSASGVISMGSLIKARGKRIMNRNAGDGKAVGLDYRKYTGKFDPTLSEMFDGPENTVFDRMARKSKLVNLFKNGINIIDHLTVNNLYIAACYDVEKSGLKPGTAEFDAAVEKLFTEATVATQPMFQAALRAENARTKNEAIRMLSMFRTQQTQNYNRLLTTIGEAKAAGNLDAEKNKALRQTIAGQVTAALSFSLLSIVADVMLHRLKKYRDDEDEEKFDANKFVERAALGAFESAAGTFWFGDTISKYLIDTISGGKTKEYYGFDFGALSTVTDALDSLNDLFKSKPEEIPWNLKKTVTYFTQVFGIPANNVYNLVNSTAMYFKDITGDNEGYFDDIIKYSTDKYSIENRFINAYTDGNQAKANKLYDTISKRKGDEDKTKTAMRTIIKDNTYSGKLSYRQSENMLIRYGMMDAEDASKRVNQYRFSAENPGVDKVSDAMADKFYSFIEGTGISASNWNKIYTAFNDFSSIKDSEGNTVTSKQDQVIDYLNGLNLTKEQKDALWEALGYKTTSKAFKNRPWRNQK